MVAIAQLVEAPIDWIDELPDSVDRARLRRFVDQAQDSYGHLMFPGWAMFRLTNMAKDSTGDEKETQYTAITAYGYFRDGPSFGVRVLDELHNLLCRDDPRYKNDRARILNEFKPGQAGLVGTITAVLIPYLGAPSLLVASGVAMALTIMGRAGLNAWCAAQGDRRKRAEQWLAERDD